MGRTTCVSGLSFITIALTVLAAGVVAAPAVAGDPSLPKLKQQLRHAKQSRQHARERARAAAADLAGARELYGGDGVAERRPGDALRRPRSTGHEWIRCRPLRRSSPPATMDQTLAATLLADGVVTADEVTALQTRSVRTPPLRAHRWTAKVRRLQQRVRGCSRSPQWNRRGQWKPLIAIAGREYGVSPAGLYRMMMLESGGQPHRERAVPRPLPVHGPRVGRQLERVARPQHLRRLVADPRHRAKRLSRGMGPSHWPLTYRMAF